MLLPDRRVIKVVFNILIADSPARAHALRICGHNGSDGCHYCDALAFKDPDSDVVTYHLRNPPHPHRLYTEVDFQHKAGGASKHHGTSVLTRAPMTLPDDAVYDQMHCTHLGITKYIAEALLLVRNLRRDARGRRMYSLDDVIRAVDNISRQLPPSAFPRSLRPLEKHGLWKASERRLFLLYVLPVLAQFYKPTVANTLLHLSFGLQVMSSPLLVREEANVSEAHLHVCRGYHGLVNFLKIPEVQVVHQLQHLYTQVSKYGSLDLCSAYPFENNLRLFKKHFTNPATVVESWRLRLWESRMEAMGSAPQQVGRAHLLPSSDPIITHQPALPASPLMKFSLEPRECYGVVDGVPGAIFPTSDLHVDFLPFTWTPAFTTTDFIEQQPWLRILAIRPIIRDVDARRIQGKALLIDDAGVLYFIVLCHFRGKFDLSHTWS